MDVIVIGAGLKPSGSALELSTLGCSSTHNNTLQVLQRTTFGSSGERSDETSSRSRASDPMLPSNENGGYVIIILI
jgi:hypothetical protein